VLEMKLRGQDEEYVQKYYLQAKWLVLREPTCIKTSSFQPLNISSQPLSLQSNILHVAKWILLP
jgi:hypothetical protein